MRLIAGVLVSVMLSLTANAADTAADLTPHPLVPPTQDTLAAAKAVAEAEFGGVVGFQDMFAALRIPIIRMFADSSHKQLADVAPTVDELILPEFRDHAEELLDIQIVSLAAHFTIPELQDLLAFYQSPTGRKTAALRPVIAQETAGPLWALSRKLLTDAIAKHADELRRRGLKL